MTIPCWNYRTSWPEPAFAAPRRSPLSRSTPSCASLEDEAQLGEFAGKIRAAIEADSINSHIALPGHTPYREYKGVPMKPRAGKGCTSCGLCAQKCPVRAIPAESPSQTDTETCISCMRCVAICPAHARSVNPLMLAAAAQKLKKSCQVRKGNELFL